MIQTVITRTLYTLAVRDYGAYARLADAGEVTYDGTGSEWVLETYAGTT